MSASARRFVNVDLAWDNNSMTGVVVLDDAGKLVDADWTRDADVDAAVLRAGEQLKSHRRYRRHRAAARPKTTATAPAATVRMGNDSSLQDSAPTFELEEKMDAGPAAWAWAGGGGDR